jgi:molybdenum cofactor synthesis domain-containing protein
MTAVNIAIVTTSDTRTPAEDTAGAALQVLAEERGWSVVGYELVRDDTAAILSALERAEAAGADVILTCGGTGLGPRDVTPEATMAFANRPVPGIAEAIRSASLAITGRAMLSRATAAQRGTTLVINLPGSEKAARETFSVIADQLEHAVDMMAGGGH